MPIDNKERIIACYAHPRTSKMFLAYTHQQQLSKSDSANQIFQHFFSLFSEAQRIKLIEHYNSMTPEQKKNPRI